MLKEARGKPDQRARARTREAALARVANPLLASGSHYQPGQFFPPIQWN
jgi:hypothetical protein